MGNINEQLKTGDRVILIRVGTHWDSKFKALLNKSFSVLGSIEEELIVDAHEYFPHERKPYGLFIYKDWFKKDEKNKQLTFVFTD